MIPAPDCPLCNACAGEPLWRDEKLRVILVDDENYPGYCRVIWNTHVREMSDLAGAEREYLWRVLNVVEKTLLDSLCPAKINLASLGNHVPHVHWHVIPRWHDDRHFPDPIWAAPNPRRQDMATPSQETAKRHGLVPAMAESMIAALDAMAPW